MFMISIYSQSKHSATKPQSQLYKIKKQHRLVLFFLYRLELLFSMFYNLGYLFFKWRKIFMNCLPNNFFINTKIFMYNFISHPINFYPRNFRIFIFDFFGDIIYCLANYGKISDDCINYHAISGKFSKSYIGSICFDFFDGFFNI